MYDIAIKVKNLSKRYRIGLKEELHDTFFGALASWVKYPLSNFRRVQKLSKFSGDGESEDTIWALKDVSFEVKHGEVLGFIGKNGAGKSTLLKILCRITEPTSGNASIHGRVASLLEVGTGFHPELTGRENVFLNGTILGMKKAEIDRKFDEIVDFSGVEKFIDTPVKRYSSGMRVRLAFAVAAHLDPEILLIDEVLAVGDVEFQKKCLGKMKDIAGEGRTVLFVSHDMGAIRKLVSRCSLLNDGKIIFIGEPTECISRYLASVIPQTTNQRMFSDRIPGEDCPVAIKGIALLDDNGESKDIFDVGESLTIEVLLEAMDNDIKFQAMVQIQNEFGANIYHCVSIDAGRPIFYSKTSAKLKVKFEQLKLYPGKYSITVGIYHPGYTSIKMDKIESAISFLIDQSAGINEVRPLGKGLAVVHEIPKWELE